MVIIFDRIWKNQKKLAVGLNDVILTGLQQGRTVTEIAIGLHNWMGAMLKYKLEDDIIIFKKEYKVSSLEKTVKKFLSTFVTTKGAFGRNPNVAILVPKRARGAYIELLSQMTTQREFLLDSNTNLQEVLSKDGLHIFEVINNE